MGNKDIHIFESGDGGELGVENNDILLSTSLFQTIYISLFGGNVEASTLGNEIDTQQRFDWWANELIFKNNKEKQFNSTTEKTLNEITLNSQGRLKLISAVRNDLEFLSEKFDFDVNVIVLELNKIRISISFENFDSSGNTVASFIWDSARNELIFDRNI